MIRAAAAEPSSRRRQRGLHAGPGPAAHPLPALFSPRCPLPRVPLCPALRTPAPPDARSRPRTLHPAAGAAGAGLCLAPPAAAAAMSGCFLFLQRLASGRRRARGDRLPPSPRDSLGGYASSLECGLSCYGSGGGALMQPLAAAAASSSYHASGACGFAAAPPTGAAAHAGGVVLCSPASSDSDCGYSSCTDSDGAPGYYYQSSCHSRGHSRSASRSQASPGAASSNTGYGSSASSGACSGGAPSPVSHLRGLSAAGEARHAAALQVRAAPGGGVGLAVVSGTAGRAREHAPAAGDAAPGPPFCHPTPPCFLLAPFHHAGRVRDCAAGAPAAGRHHRRLPLCAQAPAPHPHAARGAQGGGGKARPAARPGAPHSRLPCLPGCGCARGAVGALRAASMRPHAGTAHAAAHAALRNSPFFHPLPPPTHPPSHPHRRSATASPSRTTRSWRRSCRRPCGPPAAAARAPPPSPSPRPPPPWPTAPPSSGVAASAVAWRRTGGGGGAAPRAPPPPRSRPASPPFASLGPAAE